MMKRSIHAVLPISGERSYYEENNWNRKILNVEKADITHDGVADFIATMIMLPPAADAEKENVDFRRCKTRKYSNKPGAESWSVLFAIVQCFQLFWKVQFLVSGLGVG